VNRNEARTLTKRIVAGLDDAYDDLIKIVKEEGWQVLGYATFDAYFVEEFKGCRFALDASKRKELTIVLANQGVSERSIGEVTGASPATTHRTKIENSKIVSGASNEAPETIKVEKITGSDGRKYSAKVTTPEEREERRRKQVKLRNEGKETREIAEILGIAVGTVSSDWNIIKAEGLNKPKKAKQVKIPAPIRAYTHDRGYIGLRQMFSDSTVERLVISLGCSMNEALEAEDQEWLDRMYGYITDGLIVLEEARTLWNRMNLRVIDGGMK